MPKAKKLPSGNWRVRVYIGKGEDGKNKYKSFTAADKAEAEYIAADFIAHKKQEKSENMTVGEALTKYIESKSNILSPTTISGYEKIKRNNFPDLMRIKISDITSDILQNEINKESLKYSPKSVISAYGLVSVTLKTYRPDFYPRVTLPKKQKTYKQLLPPDVVFNAVKGTDVELAALLAMWLSLRKSEIRGIKKSDIVNGVLTIQRVIVYVDGENVVKSATKTYDSARRLRVPPYIQSLIDKTTTEYVVPLSGFSIYHRFEACLEKHNLPHMSFHDLRHLNASVMVMLGIPDKYAMERGGWSTNRTLQNVYQHTFSTERDIVDDKIDKYFETMIQGIT